MSDNTEDITRFMSFTNVSFNVAKEYIDGYGDINTAMEAYYEDQKDNVQEKREREKAHNVSRPAFSPSVSSSGPSSAAGSHSVSRTASNSKFMSFSDMVRSNADREDEENDGKPRNTFAGGETSGLEVTDPNGDKKDSNSLIRDLLEKAKRNSEQMEEGSSAPHTQEPKHDFTGKGYRLGSMVDKPSEVVEDFTPEDANKDTGKVTREITFWKEGFQVGDGELYRYDDPANAFFLNELNQGRAPLKLLNVEFGQEVEVNVLKKLDESFKAPKRKFAGFQGHGQRLGSPIPGDSMSPGVVETPASSAATVKAEVPNVEVKKTEGDISVQIRYATGKREVYHCNSTDKVSSLYEHVKANTDDHSRTFTLNYAFPVKPIEVMDQTLIEADLKNSVVVQRWV
ncbi:UBX domain-containing protein 1 [Monosporozyma servazzii]